MQMSDDTLLGKLGSLDQNFLWASMLWGAVASGYFIYGWKQRSVLPFLGGAADDCCVISDSQRALDVANVHRADFRCSLVD